MTKGTLRALLQIIVPRRPGARRAGAGVAGFLLLAGFVCMPGVGAAQDAAPPVEETVVVDDAEAAANDLDLIGSEVRQVQQALRDRGFFVGPADGRKEMRLRVALRDFQRAEGLPVTGSLDKGTLVRLGLVLPDAPAQADTPAESLTATASEAPSEALPEVSPEASPAAESPVETEPTPVASSPSSQDKATKDLVSLGKVGVKGVTKGVVKAGESVVTAGEAVGQAGETTGEAVAEGGKAVGKAGVVTADAAATAATTTAEAAKVSAVAVAKAPVALYEVGRRVLFGHDKKGKSSSDEKIRQSIERSFSEDDRIVPEEVEVLVSGGNVTLVFPQNPRSDVSYAARIAKLTPGVVSVNAIYRAPGTVMVPEASETASPAPLSDSAPSAEDGPQ